MGGPPRQSRPRSGPSWPCWHGPLVGACGTTGSTGAHRWIPRRLSCRGHEGSLCFLAECCWPPSSGDLPGCEGKKGILQSIGQDQDPATTGAHLQALTGRETGGEAIRDDCCWSRTHGPSRTRRRQEGNPGLCLGRRRRRSRHVSDGNPCRDPLCHVLTVGQRSEASSPHHSRPCSLGSSGDFWLCWERADLSKSLLGQCTGARAGDLDASGPLRSHSVYQGSLQTACFALRPSLSFLVDLAAHSQLDSPWVLGLSQEVMGVSSAGCCSHLFGGCCSPAPPAVLGCFHCTSTLRPDCVPNNCIGGSGTVTFLVSRPGGSLVFPIFGPDAPHYPYVGLWTRAHAPVFLHRCCVVNFCCSVGQSFVHHGLQMATASRPRIEVSLPDWALGGAQNSCIGCSGAAALRTRNIDCHRIYPMAASPACLCFILVAVCSICCTAAWCVLGGFACGVLEFLGNLGCHFPQALSWKPAPSVRVGCHAVVSLLGIALQFGAYHCPQDQALTWVEMQSASVLCMVQVLVTCSLLRLLLWQLGLSCSPGGRLLLAVVAWAPTQTVLAFDSIRNGGGPFLPDARKRKPTRPIANIGGKRLNFWAYTLCLLALPVGIEAGPIGLSSGILLLPICLPNTVAGMARPPQPDDPPFCPRPHLIPPEELVAQTGTCAVPPLGSRPEVAAARAPDRWLGVYIFTPYYTTITAAVKFHCPASVDQVCELIRDRIPGVPVGPFDVVVPLRPQRFPEYPAFLRLPSIIRYQGPDGHSGIVLDLTRVGGRYFATVLPKRLDYDTLLRFITPLTAHNDLPLCVYAAFFQNPWPEGVPLDLHDGDVLTFSHGPLTAYARHAVDPTFQPDAIWGDLRHMPGIESTDCVCLMHGDRRFTLPPTTIMGRQLCKLRQGA